MVSNIWLYGVLLFSLSAMAQTTEDIGLAKLLEQDEHRRQLDELTKSKESNNSVELVHLGRNSKLKRFELLESAKEYIFITVPYWFSDEEGTLFYERVKEIKQRKPSLDIKVMIDWTTPASTSDFFAVKMFKKLEDLLGKENVIQWNKFWNFRNFSSKIMNNRIHDKIFVVDGKRMITGGMNIGNDYLMGGSTRKGWHDTDIYVEGPAAQEGAKIFLKPYLLQRYLDGFFGHPFPRQKKYQLQLLHNLFYHDIDETRWPSLFFGLKRTFKIPYRHDYLENQRYFPTLSQDESGDVPVRLIYDNPLVDRKIVDVPTILKLKKTKKKVVRVSKYVDTIEYVGPLAKKSLRLFVPYLTISKRMMKFLLERAKHLKVEIITNSLISHDLGKFNYQASLPTIKQLVEGGVHVYEWQGHSRLESLEKEHQCTIQEYWPGHTIHTKAAIFDGEIAFIGSHNMNVRSEKFNSEMMVMLRDRNLAQDLEEVFDYDLDLDNERTVKCGELTLARPPRTERVSEEYLEKTVKGLKYKLLPLLYPVM